MEMGLLNSVLLQAKTGSWDYSSCIMMSEKNLKYNRSEMLHTYERNGLFQNIEIAGEGGWNFPGPCLYSEDKAPGDLEVKLAVTPPSVGV